MGGGGGVVGVLGVFLRGTLPELVDCEWYGSVVGRRYGGAVEWWSGSVVRILHFTT